jgi:predicted dehydrogenase
MSKKIGIAVIGSGRIAYSHLNAINDLKDRSELIATVDIVEEVAKNAALKFEAKRYYTNLDDALNDKEINAVVISLPHYLHRDVCIKAANKGKNILIEKPLTNTVEEAKDVIRAASENNVKLMVGHSQRFHTAAIESKKIFNSGQIGNIIDINVSLLGYVDKPPTSWWVSKEKTGGLLIPLWGSHIIDYILWLTGKFPDRVYAETLSSNPIWEGEDEAAIVMGFDDNMIVNIVMSYNTRISQSEGEGFILPTPEYNRYIIGTKGTLHLKDYTELYLNEKIIVGGEQKPSIFYLQMKEFLNSLLENREPSISGKEILKVIQVMEASRISAEKHEVIKFN